MALGVLLRPGELEAHHSLDLLEPFGVGELGEPVQDRHHPGGPEVLQVDQPPQVGVVRGRGSPR